MNPMNCSRLIGILICASMFLGKVSATSAATTVAVTGSNFATDKDGLASFVIRDAAAAAVVGE